MLNGGIEMTSRVITIPMIQSGVDIIRESNMETSSGSSQIVGTETLLPFEMLYTDADDNIEMLYTNFDANKPQSEAAMLVGLLVKESAL